MAEAAALALAIRRQSARSRPPEHRSHAAIFAAAIAACAFAIMYAGASAPRIPPARRRSRRRATGGGGRDGLPAYRGAKRVMAAQLRRLEISGSIPRRNCATRVQAHRCVLVGVPVKSPLADGHGRSAPSAPPHIPIRPPAVAATGYGAAGGGTGRRQRAARSALCHPTRARGIYRPEQPRHGRAGCASASGDGSALCHPTGPSGRYRAAQPRGACRLRVGIPVTGPLANVAGLTAPCCAIHRPAPRKPMDAAPSARRASPSARRRSRRRTGGRRARGRGGRHRAREARHATQGGSIARPNCATGVQAAGRHPGEVAARRRSW
jgi:hypothetical protein